MDDDGDLDVVALSTSALVWIENPDWQIHLIAEVVLHDVEVADFDGDGDFDIVGRDQGEFGHSGQTLHYYYQDSMSTWRHVEIDCPDGEGLATADVDADGDQDVVINSVWFENTRLESPPVWKQHEYAPRWLHAATFVNVVDLNRDGHLDIVLSPSELAGDHYRISWFAAPDDPRLGAWREHPIALDVETVHHFVGTADLDLDGDIDVVTAEMAQGQDPDEVSVFRNLGNNLDWSKEVIATTGSHSMRLLDVDQDGDIDLFGANHQGQQVDLWINETRRPNGNSLPSGDARNDSLQQPASQWTYVLICDSLPARCFGVAAADVDQDGDEDLAIGQTLLLNPGGEMTSAWKQLELGSELDANVMLDLSQDGNIDILAQRLPELVWLAADDISAGSFVERVIAEDIVQTGHGSSQGFTFADVSGDGVEDYILTTGEGILVVPIPQDLQSLPWTTVQVTGNAPEEGVAVGDIDADGWPDVIAWIGSGSGSNQLGWWKNPGRWKATDAIGDWELYPIGDVTGAEGDRVAVGDFDQDGHLDVIGTGTTNQAQGSSVVWFRNPGTHARKSSWARNSIAENVGAMNSMSVADLNGDQVPDVVTGEHRGQKRVSIWFNVAHGSQWEQIEVDHGKESHLGTQLFDLDQDGDLDIVSIAWDEFRQVHMWRNDIGR